MNEKYSITLGLMNQLIAISRNSESTYQNLVEGWNKLYDYIYPNFDHPKNLNTEEDVEQVICECQEMLNHDVGTVLNKLTKIPPEYTDYVFPVAIARHLLRYNGEVGLVMKTDDIISGEFFYRYAAMIMSPRIPG